VRGAITVAAIVGLLSLLLIAVAFAQSQTKPQPTPPQPAQPQTPIPGNQTRSQAGEEVGEDDVIRVNTNLVTSAALVIGRDRKYVPTLRRQDFHVFEDGVEQELAYFAPVDRPFTVALLIDNSHSTIFELRNIQDAAIALVNQMRANDRAVIISLADDIKTLAGPTNSKEVLRGAISNLKTGGDTRLYDAVDFAINRGMAGITGRKAILLLTDGVDNASRNATYQTNLNEIAQSDVQVYAVQFSTYALVSKQAARFRRPPPEGTGFSRVDYQRADAYLHQISELTGTSVYPAATLSNLDSAIASIGEELHNEYSLGYYPRIAGKPGEVRRVEVRVNQPWLVARARPSYSFGQAGTVRYDNRDPALAPLSDIESLSASQYFVENKRPLNARWMCKGPFVPGDYALVQEGFDAKCPKSTRADDKTNAWLIKKPGPSEIVCKGFWLWNGSEMEISPIPSGYAVVGEVNSPMCSSSMDPKASANAWRVKLPVSEETVCKGFLIPRGFVVVGEKNASVCPATSSGANAWLIVPTPYIETRRFWSVP
jgi:Ca-activated chloride channel family protein